MIQPLRNAHRQGFSALAVVLPAILVVGLMARHRSESVSADALKSTDAVRAFKVSAGWQKHSIETYFYLNPVRDGEIAVILTPKPALDEPDLLLYWAGSDGSGTNLSQARLLGPFVPNKNYSIPAGERRGELVLYSLAHATVIDRAKIEGLP
jgi:hypothetical protein